MKNLTGKFFKGPWLLFFILSLLYGCSGTSTGNPGPMASNETGSGNPETIETASQTYVSALPDPIYPGSLDTVSDGDVDTDHYTTDDYTFNTDTHTGSDVVVYPDIFRSINNILFVTGTNRGMQIVDIPTDSTPMIRGNLDIGGTHKDISLSGNRAYLLTNSSFKGINIEDRDQLFVEESINLSINVFKTFPYLSDLVRLSRRSDGKTEVDLVPEQEMDQPVSSGLVLPIQVHSANQYGDRLWLRGKSSANWKDYLIGIDIEQLSLAQDLLDFSEMISAFPDSTPLSAPDSPIFAIVEVPATNLANDLFMGSSYSKTMEMLYGIWMDTYLCVVVADDSIYIYDLEKSGELSSIISISFQPESFFTSGSILSFSFLISVDAPEGEDPTKNYSKFFYKSFDLSDPLTPIKSGEVNIPGTLLSLKNGQIFTLDFSWSTAGNLIETVTYGNVIDNNMTTIGKHLLSRRTTNRIASGSGVVVLYVDYLPDWYGLVRVIDFSDPENPVEAWN